MFFQLNPIGAINAIESKNIEQKENREKWKIAMETGWLRTQV